MRPKERVGQHTSTPAGYLRGFSRDDSGLIKNVKYLKDGENFEKWECKYWA